MTALSAMQTHAIDEFLDWYEKIPKTWAHCHGASDCPKQPHTHGNGQLAPVTSIGGLAGTGKTTIMRELDLLVRGEAVMGTPTHKAAGVLRKKVGEKQRERVRTYHSLTYVMTPNFRCSTTNRLVSAIQDKCTCVKPDGECECPLSFLPCGAGAQHECRITQELKAERRVHLGGHRDLVIIDEASMLNLEQINDIRQFGVPVLLVGDHGQLPPIKGAMNPWIKDPKILLTEVHRQGADSGILQAAYDVRSNGRMTRAFYGGPKPDVARYPYSSTVASDLLLRFRPGPQGALITYTNRLRARLNRVYHQKLVGGSDPVAPGDQVVALGGLPYEAARVVMDTNGPRATGEFLKVHNGMTGTVLKTSVRGVVTELTVALDDHPLAKPDQPVVILSGATPTAQYGADEALPFNSPLRPKGTHLWDLAYALTAHKAQGSEWPHVVIADQGPREYNRWMYTALTRAQKAAIVVDWAA